MTPADDRRSPRLPGRSPLRERLGLRLALVLLATLGLVGVLQYVLVADGVRRDLVAAQSAYHASDARTIERAVREADGDETIFDEASEELREIDDRPHVDEAVITDSTGRVVAASEPSEIGQFEDEPQVRVSASTGESFAAVESYLDHGRTDDHHFSYITPVVLDGRRYAFEIEQDRASAAAPVAGVRRHLAVPLAASSLIAVLLFYLFGGRQVDRLYRLALDRARRDGLTDLGNLRAFGEDLAATTSRSRRSGAPVAVAMIDVDDFKFLNDEHGHRHGDAVLGEVAAVLGETRAGDRAYRVGGDEFALVLEGVDAAGACPVLHRLVAAAHARLDGATLSIGVAGTEEAAPADAEALIERADRALYAAKRRGGGTVVCDSQLTCEDAPSAPMGKVRALRRLIADADIDVAFQPIADLHGDALLGYEALARPRALHGLAHTGEAFDVAERTGRGHELDTVCRAAALAGASALPDGARLFLNLSPQSLEHDALPGDTLVARCAPRAWSLATWCWR
ncbi:MAG TPA: diguanylate cyclase [Solirubrobacteraceae bacterium]|nr:diguanylate cyclase [Solirubrobacteraceae bacterium]